MLKLFKGLNIFTKMYGSEPANLHIFYVKICQCEDSTINRLVRVKLRHAASGVSRNMTSEATTGQRELEKYVLFKGVKKVLFGSSLASLLPGACRMAKLEPKRGPASQRLGSQRRQTHIPPKWYRPKRRGDSVKCCRRYWERNYMQQSSGGHQNQLPGTWECRSWRRAVEYLAWGCLADESVSTENRYRWGCPRCY
jgi:hypothetical protein